MRHLLSEGWGRYARGVAFKNPRYSAPSFALICLLLLLSVLVHIPETIRFSCCIAGWGLLMLNGLIAYSLRQFPFDPWLE